MASRISSPGNSSQRTEEVCRDEMKTYNQYLSLEIIRGCGERDDIRQVGLRRSASFGRNGA